MPYLLVGSTLKGKSLRLLEQIFPFERRPCQKVSHLDKQTGIIASQYKIISGKEVGRCLLEQGHLLGLILCIISNFTGLKIISSISYSVPVIGYKSCYRQLFATVNQVSLQTAYLPSSG